MEKYSATGIEVPTEMAEPEPEGLGADYQQGYLDGYDAALGDAVRAVEGLGAIG